MTEVSFDVNLIKEENLEEEEVAASDGSKITKTGKRSSKRGRKPSKIDVKAKLERSRQSARECRARKKLRYQYLEELVASRERSVYQLRNELEQFKQWARDVDEGLAPAEMKEQLDKEARRRAESGSSVCSYVMRPRRRTNTDRTDRTDSESSVASSYLSVQSP